MRATAPLSDQLSYYFAAIMAEKGVNGEIILEDAWLQYDNVKAVFEVNYDLLEKDDIKDGVGHDTKEHYVLVGIDLAF